MIDDDDDDTQVYQSQFGLANSYYRNGWNDALDKAIERISEIKGFGQTTHDSFAVFIKGLKK